MDGALRLMDVPPDDIDTWMAAQAKAQHAERSCAAKTAGAAGCRRRHAAGGNGTLPTRHTGRCAMNRSMLLRELLPDVAGIPGDLRITGLVMDSRELKPGDAFVAIAGFGAHGLKFVEQARAARASAILFEPPAPHDLPAPADAIAVPNLRARLGELADHFHGHATRSDDHGWRDRHQRQDLDGAVAGAGVDLARHSLWQRRHAWAPACYGQVKPTGFTTPLVLSCTNCWRRCATPARRRWRWKSVRTRSTRGASTACISMSAVFTNLTRDHLDYHGDMDAYGAAKARLFAWPGLKAAAINLDDDYGRARACAIASVGLTRHRTEFARRRHGATLRAEALRLDSAGIAFDLVGDNETHPVHSPLLGRFNVDNLLAVAGALYALGDTPAQIATTLSQLQPIHGRMNRLGGEAADKRPLVVIDYAHTPDALEQALQSLRAHAQARLICVFGCGGERDRGKRPQMAAIAEANADIVIVTDDNPRAEDGDRIVADILAGFARPDAVIVQRDRAAAIARAIGEAGPNDIVLIAGKGHEPYQEINGVQYPFDDTEVARASWRCTHEAAAPFRCRPHDRRATPGRRRHHRCHRHRYARAPTTGSVLFVALKGERFDGHDHVAAGGAGRRRCRAGVARRSTPRRRRCRRSWSPTRERALADFAAAMQRERDGEGRSASPAATARPA